MSATQTPADAGSRAAATRDAGSGAAATGAAGSGAAATGAPGSRAAATGAAGSGAAGLRDAGSGAAATGVAGSRAAAKRDAGSGAAATGVAGSRDAGSRAAAKDGSRTVRSVVHAVGLLRSLSKSGTPSSLGELASEVGLSKPATFNLLKTLELEGLVAKDSSARYRLTWGMYELGSAVVRSTDLSRVGRFHLDSLAEATGEAVLLAILNDNSVLYIDRGQSADSFAMVANVGRRSPLHTNASGKVLLAWQSSEFLDEFFAAGPLERKTPYTITDPDRLREELAAVRRDGYAMCAQEQEEGLSSISVPVIGHTGEVLAAMTIAAPTQRIDLRSAPGLRKQLAAEAAAMSAHLGAETAGE